jgi:hypothetical protein
MRATHWLIGCTLCFGSMGAAHATSMDTQDLDASAHSATDNGGARDNGNGSGDVLGLIRDSTAHGSGSDNSGSSLGNGTDRSGGATSTPARTRQPHLGWQSLLPGSIQ